jgi:hypothetical protein
MTTLILLTLHPGGLESALTKTAIILKKKKKKKKEEKSLMSTAATANLFEKFWLAQ